MSWALGRVAMFFLIFGMGWRGGFAEAAFSVRGSVLDSTGAAVPGATVQLQTSGGEVVSQSQTDARGDFTFLNVSGGDISIVVPAYSGFAARTVAIHVTGNVSGIKVTLSTESVRQEVTVGAEPTLSTDSGANRDTITTTGDELRKLPVFDQDYIAALTPFLDASAGSSGGVTIIVDGVEMKSAGVCFCDSGGSGEQRSVFGGVYPAGPGTDRDHDEARLTDLSWRSELHFSRRGLQCEELLFPSEAT